MHLSTATRVLGLAHACPSRDDLVGAWRRFARAHHPDRCPGDPGAAGRFATGREAFETLLRRIAEPAPAPLAAYDRRGVVRGAPAAGAPPYEMRPLPIRQWWA
jgi:DnaJ-class molecular chaperone